MMSRKLVRLFQAACAPAAASVIGLVGCKFAGDERAASIDAFAYMKSVNESTLREANASTACNEGMSSGFGWTQFFQGGDLLRARVAFAANRGHDVWEYHFYYKGGAPLVVRHRVSDWRRSTGMATSDFVVERTYQFTGDRPVRCLEAEVQTPSDEKEQALLQAEQRDIPCTDASWLLEMARAARKKNGELGWLRQQCQTQGRSAALLSRIRRERAAQEVPSR